MTKRKKRLFDLVEAKPSGTEPPPSFYHFLVKMMEEHKDEIIAGVEAERAAHDGMQSA